MEKPEFTLSYNRDKGTPNWVSWHLSDEWIGTLSRVDTFRPDPQVPPDWYRVQSFDYSGSGFDRGHMTPNADRDNQFRIPINQETYLMSNMVPQSPDNNQGPWADLEAYLRTLTDVGNEIYIVSGPNGVGGVGSNSGSTVMTIANGHVTVPSSTWKVALVLPKQDGDDISRVTCSTRTIAVLMPNVQGIRGNPWDTYLTTVDAIEQLTGYDFYSNLPPAVQACIEAGTNGTNPPGTANQSANTAEDTAVTITLQALRPDNNPVTFSIVSGPANGALGSVSAASCSDGGCTATVDYTPGPDYNGADSFTFKATDNGVSSNTSSVSITIAEVNDDVTAADDNKSTNEDTTLNFPASDLTGNDSAGPANESGQTLTVTSVTPTANTHGTVSLNSGQVSYSPADNYNGAASFTYQVCDNGTTNGASDSKCATGTVNVTVNPVNDTPVVANDAYNTNEDTTLNGSSVLANDSDVDNDPLTAELVSTTHHGVLNFNVDGTFTYSPAANYNGPDSFTYKAKDPSNAESNVATVSLTINPVNDPPVAANDSYVTNSNSPLNVNAPGVLANDTDIDSSITAVLASGPSHGTLALNADGSFTYTPSSDYTSNDTFTYSAYDGAAYSNTATVTITVNDTVAPVISSSVAMPLISATNSNLFNVGLIATATDNSGAPITVEVAVFGDEDDQTPTFNNTVHSPDAKDIGPSNTLRLRGERIESGDGRVYLIVLTAMDPSGNTSHSYQTVVVPKGNKQANIDSVNAQAAAAVSHAQSHNGAPPPGYFVIGDGPIIGPKQ